MSREREGERDREREEERKIYRERERKIEGIPWSAITVRGAS